MIVKMNRFDVDNDEINHFASDIKTSLKEPTNLEDTASKCLLNIKKTQETIEKFETEAIERMKDLEKCETKCTEKRTKLSIGTEIEQENEQIRAKLEHFSNCQSSIQTKQQTSKEILSNFTFKREKLKQVEKEREVIGEELKEQKNDFRLLNNMTHVTMDLTTEPYVCKGSFVKDISKKTEVKTFELNREESSMFLITNHLWDLIDD